MRRLSAFATLLLVTRLSMPLPSAAAAEDQIGDATGSSNTSAGTIGAGVDGDGGTTTGDNGDSGGTGSGGNNDGVVLGDCTEVLADEETSAQLDEMVGRPHPGAPGYWVIRFCVGVSSAVVTVFVVDRPSAEELAQDAYERAVLPLPSPVLSPPAEADQMVRVTTWLATDPQAWVPVAVSASAGALTATTTARPVETVWLMGDGAVVTCAGPGTLWAPGTQATPTCSHVYTRSSAAQPDDRFRVVVATRWDVSWSATNGEGGTLASIWRSTELRSRVVESQALVTR